MMSALPTEQNLLPENEAITRILPTALGDTSNSLRDIQNNYDSNASDSDSDSESNSEHENCSIANEDLQVIAAIDRKEQENTEVPSHVQFNQDNVTEKDTSLDRKCDSLEKEIIIENEVQNDVSNSERGTSPYNDSSDSDSEDDSEDSEEDSDSDSEDDKSDEKPVMNSKKKELDENESWLSILGLDKVSTDLPDIASLDLNDKDEFIHMGNFENVIDKIMTVAGLPHLPAYDLDTLLFLEEGKTILGYVIDVMGHVEAPTYILPITTIDQNNPKFQKGAKVYCAPRSKYTKYVLVDELIKIRGSDASWVGDIEVPDEFKDYSDDEQEHKDKKPNKRKRDQNQQAGNTYNMNCLPQGSNSDMHPQFRNNHQNVRMSSPSLQNNKVVNPVAFAGLNLTGFNPTVPPPNFGNPPVSAPRFTPFGSATRHQGSVHRTDNFNGSLGRMVPRQNMSLPYNTQTENIPGPYNVQRQNMPGPFSDPRQNIPGPFIDPMRNMPGPFSDPRQNMPGPFRDPRPNMSGPYGDPRHNLPGSNSDPRQNIPGPYNGSWFG